MKHIQFVLFHTITHQVHFSELRFFIHHVDKYNILLYTKNQQQFYVDFIYVWGGDSFRNESLFKLFKSELKRENFNLNITIRIPTKYRTIYIRTQINVHFFCEFYFNLIQFTKKLNNP